MPFPVTFRVAKLVATSPYLPRKWGPATAVLGRRIGVVTSRVARLVATSPYLPRSSPETGPETSVLSVGIGAKSF